jgi:hypothetical protein
MFKSEAKLFLPILAASLMISGCEKNSFSFLQEEWNNDNLPTWFDPEIETTFSMLPISGSLDYIPWTGSAWPSYRGGLALRWLSPAADAWQDYLYTLDELRSMSYDEIARLSPTEKYDIFSDDYSYSLTLAERARVSPNDPHWYGVCHGLAAASLLYAEPHPIVTKNAAGITVPFSSADLKGLFTLVQATADPAIANWRYIGVRCDSDLMIPPGGLNTDACRDSNAGAFHVALTNEVGIHKRGFVIDRTRGSIIWNRPVFGFTSQVAGEQGPTPGAAPGTVRELLMETKVYTVKSSNAQWNVALNSNDVPTGTEDYKYRLELDSSGRIVGGEWSSWERPDFAWKTLNTDIESYMVGSFANLRKLNLLMASAPTAARPGARPLPTPIATPTVSPTASPTIAPTVSPTPSPVNSRIETVVAAGESAFEFDVRVDRTYSESEWIEIEGRLQNILTPSARMELRKGSVLLATSLSNISTRRFSLRFKLPAGNYPDLTLNLLDYQTGELSNHASFALKVISR